MEYFITSCTFNEMFYFKLLVDSHNEHSAYCTRLCHVFLEWIVKQQVVCVTPLLFT